MVIYHISVPILVFSVLFYLLCSCPIWSGLVWSSDVCWRLMFVLGWLFYSNNCSTDEKSSLG